MAGEIEPSEIDYPRTKEERETYWRLKLAKGVKLLTSIDVELIRRARAKRRERRERRSKRLS